MKIKKFCALTLALVCACTLLTGCGDEEPVADESGERLYLSADELGLDDTGREGFFVMNDDGTFSPVINTFDGYQGDADESTPDRYLWFTNNDTDISSLIPTATKSNPLVMVYDVDQNIPETFTLEKYLFRGYTIGCHIYKNSDNSLYFSTDDALSSSYAGTSMQEVQGDDEFKISTVNGSQKLPSGNVDNNLGMLLGLEKGKYYDFEYYQGTKYRKLTTIADTLVLQSEDLITLTNPYTKTENGYFTINLPDNLETGYYYICGAGLFKYVAK